MRLTAAAIVLIAITWISTAALADIYTWTDDSGVTHMATSLKDVPEKYRDQVSTMKSEKPTANQTKPQAPAAREMPSEVIENESGLRRFEVPYENEGSAKRIIIPVTFNGQVTKPMALDTGSPGLVIFLDLAEELRLFSRDRGTLFTEAAGIGGEVLAIRTIVDSVAVDGASSNFVPTTITDSLSDKFYGLIGMDFLANYNISIDTRDQVVVFQEVVPEPGSRGGHDEEWWRKTFEDFRAVRDHWKELADAWEDGSANRPNRFIEFQARESDRLLQRLNNFASDNAVPQHWR